MFFQKGAFSLHIVRADNELCNLFYSFIYPTLVAQLQRATKYTFAIPLVSVLDFMSDLFSPWNCSEAYSTPLVVPPGNLFDCLEHSVFFIGFKPQLCFVNTQTPCHNALIK